MKKFYYILFIATMFGMALVSCGDDDKPDTPVSQQIESVYANENDTRFVFDINMDKDSSSIYLYNVVFTIGEAQSPAMNIRIDAPVTVDKSGKIYTYAGTNITPFLLRGNTPVPMSSMPVTNLTCNVDTKNKTFNIFFNCHGGEYSNNGKLK
jgi:hypothetical protein